MQNFTISFTILETMNLDFDEDFRIDFIYMNMMLGSICWSWLIFVSGPLTKGSYWTTDQRVLWERLIRVEGAQVNTPCSRGILGTCMSRVMLYINTIVTLVYQIMDY